MTPLRGALGVLLLISLFCLLRFVRAYRWSDVDFHPPKMPPLVMPQGGPWAEARAVEFGDGLRGWYLPSRNGAGIVLCHGTETDRRSLIPAAELLARHGFGALLYDFPGHGESKGVIRWNLPERASVRAAVDFLVAQEGVRRVGALGQSMGSYILAKGAADEPRIGAYVLLSTFADLREMTRRQLGTLGSLWVIAGMWADERNGLDPREARPLDDVAKIAPRPLLLGSGELDHSIPPSDTRALFAAAREPKQLWIAPGADHSEEIVKDPAQADALIPAAFSSLLRP